MKRLALSTALAALIALPGFAQDAEPKHGGNMIVTYKDDVATLDPAIGYDWQNWSMIKSLFDGLMDYVPGTTTLWRCVLGICVVIASVAWDLNRK